MSETGAIKFKAEQEKTALAKFSSFEALNRYRSKLWHLHLLGTDENGIGFGNVSVRETRDSHFYITGSGTGHKAELDLIDYAKVLSWDFSRNSLRYAGATVASSESLTHASIYEADPTVGAIIHGHSSSLWTTLLEEAPATPAAIEYGTPAMAHAVRRLFETTDVRARKAFAMAGHRGGVVFFGRDLEEAFSELMELERPNGGS
jgi:ribulose-5-phosphate 4-epimerase/fuculose-1-phosphate aldolase